MNEHVDRRGRPANISTLTLMVIGSFGTKILWPWLLVNLFKSFFLHWPQKKV
jgi:hypothetical protein